MAAVRTFATVMILACFAGCAAEPKQAPVTSRVLGGRVINSPAGMARTSHVVAAVAPFGAAPYDNQSLPIVSPDARFVATVTGVAATWPTVRAEPDASIPIASRVQIYALDLRTEISPSERRAPQQIASLREPVLLGRSCDNAGFLIEAPQEDGSRWIGHAAWETGEITWLVADEQVNAFATLGRNGRLAWSRRTVGAEQFELVVRNGETETVIPAQDGQWLMPTWGDTGDGLFVLHLREGELSMLYAIAASEDALRQSLGLQRVFLASGATIDTAYQTVAAQITNAGVPSGVSDDFTFLHPSEARMAIWQPLLARGPKLALLHARSFAALHTDDGYALVSTQEELLRQSLADPREFTPVLRGLSVPRRIALPEMPYMLLGIPLDRGGQIGISGLTLLPGSSVVATPVG